MICRTPSGRVALLVLVAFGLAAPQAGAQAWPPSDRHPAAETGAADANGADPGDLELDWSQLNVDASTLADRPAKALAPRAGASSDAAWSSSNKPNGGAAVTVKQAVSPFWDTRVGADMTVVHEPTTMSELLSERLANGGSAPQSSGTAWAAATAPGVGPIWDKTAIEARIDAAQDQSRLGTSLSKSLPLSEQYSLTLQNGYNLIQQGAVPVPGIVAHPSRDFQTEQSARLSVTDTGTSFIAGQTLSSTDDKWLRKIGAEQKLFDGVSITGSIGETPLGVTNKSVSAGFKRSW
ncbi:MAG: hypothetical protein QOF07_1719 [Bradyrhizobium sp.]|jgi:hypothetical protein|nr:hypothetical protein [Bradyrhizobium sp.]